MTDKNPNSNHIPKKENAGYMEQLMRGSTEYFGIYRVG